jgi:hypothetical protein
LVFFFCEVGASKFLPLLLEYFKEINLLLLLLFFFLLFLKFSFKFFFGDFLFLKDLAHISTFSAAWSTEFSGTIAEKKFCDFTLAIDSCHMEASAAREIQSINISILFNQNSGAFQRANLGCPMERLGSIKC